MTHINQRQCRNQKESQQLNVFWRSFANDRS
jgi:hypothetical protein